jgi:Holliday junction resolvase
MTRYSSGVQFEYQVRDYLLRNFWPVVVRSAGSHGPIDLVGINSGGMCFVQCKQERKKKSYKSDELDLVRISSPSNCRKFLFVKRLNKSVLIKNVVSGDCVDLPIAVFKLHSGSGDIDRLSIWR